MRGMHIKLKVYSHCSDKCAFFSKKCKIIVNRWNTENSNNPAPYAILIEIERSGTLEN